MKILFDEKSLPDLNTLKAKNYNDVELKEWTFADEGKPSPSGAKRIGVLTSGGDAPGMNAAVRAVVRAGLKAGLEIYGIKHGYDGLLRGAFEELDRHSVSETIQRGGTFLKTARSEEFKTPQGILRGAKMAEIYNLDALITIGGDGTFKGALELARIGVPIIGIPATIDNDVSSSDYTIGYDTAMNTAVEAIDKLRDTASSHQRCSVIEVMGRSAGYIAYYVGIATGAECILIPEVEYDIDKNVIRVVLEGMNTGKKHWIIVVAEGAGDASEIAAKVEAATGFESRATVLGYIQRGGSPTLKDRCSASFMGIRAVDCILSGRFNRLIVEKNGKVTDIDITEGLNETKTIEAKDIEQVGRLF